MENLKQLINSLWEDVEQGNIIHWENKGYTVCASEASQYNKSHFTYKNGKVLVTRHIEGHQSILHESDISKLF